MDIGRQATALQAEPRRGRDDVTRVAPTAIVRFGRHGDFPDMVRLQLQGRPRNQAAVRAADATDRAIEAGAQVQRYWIVCGDVLGAVYRLRWRERGGIGGAEVTGQREGVRHAPLDGTPQSSKSRS